MKILRLVLMISLLSLANADNLESKSNEELIQKAKSLDSNSIKDFAKEVKKRLKDMDEKVRVEFVQKIEDAYKEGAKHLNAKEFKKYSDSLKSSLKEGLDTVEDKAKKAYKAAKDGWDELTN